MHSMGKQFFKSSTLKLVLLPIIFIFLSTACLSSSKLVTMNISESNLNLLFGDPVFQFPGEDLSLSVTSLDIRDELVRVNGEFVDGQSATFPGYFDLDLRVEKGAVLAEIIQIEFPGITINDELPSFIEARIEDNIENAASRSGDRITIDEMIFVPNGLQVRIRIAPEPTAISP